MDSVNKKYLGTVMFVDLHSIIYPLLFITGLLAGTVDAVAGGGGLISLPVLVKLRTALRGIIFVFIGAIIGAISAQVVSGAILKSMIPILLLIILIYAIFAPKFGAEDQHPRLSESHYCIIFGLLLGAYDGFLGPGVGSFWLFSIIYFLGYNLTKATAHTKVFNLTSNLAALLCFAFGHNIDYRVGFCMAVGQLIGGRFGAHLAINNGAKLIRPVFLVMVSATILTLIYKQMYAI
jgi:uncharacterized membrane protein YfcA